MVALWASPAAAQPTCPAVVSQLKTAPEADRPALLQTGVTACCTEAQGPSGPFFCGLVRHDLGQFDAAVRQYQAYLAGSDNRRGAQGRRASAGTWLAYASQGKFRDGTAPPVVEPVAPPSTAPAPSSTAPAPAPPARHTVTVRCTPPDAQLTVDATPRGLCSTAKLSLAPGEHVIGAQAPGFVGQTRPIQLTKSVAIDIALTPAPTPRSSLGPWIVGGAGLVAMGVGGWLHSENLSHFDTLVNSRDRGLLDQPRADQVDDARVGAIGSYVVGSVLLTAAITWLLWPDDAEEAGQ